MNKEQDERLVVAFSRIASALEGFHEEVRKAGKRYWPEPGQQKESVVSHVPTEEDKIKERQGSGDDRPIKEWLSDLGDPEGDAGIVGDRSRQWIIDHPPEKEKVSTPSPQTVSVRKQDAPSAEEAESQT
jgi:hypothetical protein